MMFAFKRISEFMTISPLTVRSLPTVASPLNITLKASDFSSEALPFPITKAVFAVLNESALFVIVEPLKLYLPITNDA